MPPAASPSAPATQAAAPAVAQPLPTTLTVRVVAGADRGRTVPLHRDEPLVVGKDRGCELALNDGLVSRRHLEIVLRESRVEARDLGSRNGSYFGGARFERLVLGVGAAIRLGLSELVIEDPAPDVAAAEPPR